MDVQEVVAPQDDSATVGRLWRGGWGDHLVNGEILYNDRDEVYQIIAIEGHELTLERIGRTRSQLLRVSDTVIANLKRPIQE